MKKIKLFFIKYSAITILIVCACVFLFTKTLPKSTNVAKKEFVEDVLKINTKTQANDTSKVVVKNDSVVMNPNKGDVVIPIEVTENSIYATAKINGIDVRFLIDTGCSDIQITSAEYYYMKHLGLVSEKDLNDEKITCVYADNSKGECHSINLKTLNIGDVELTNITATIQENADASILLGQNVLRKLGKVTIDYEGKKIIIKKNC